MIGYYHITITNGEKDLQCKVPSKFSMPDYLFNKAMAAHKIKKDVSKWKLKETPKLIKWLGGGLHNDTQSGTDLE